MVDVDLLYSQLITQLDKDQHSDECVYRCMNRDCGADHWCYVCAKQRDPIEIYGTDEHEAWLVEMERRNDYQ